jgi:hypothetical protein
MTTQVNFNFFSWTKHDLMKFIYTEEQLRKVDSAIPKETADRIRDINGDIQSPFWYVQDYNENPIFGKTINLKEAFFNKLANNAINQ